MTPPDAPTLDQLYRAIDETWPAARKVEQGVWTLRDGQGGGQRVSAATARAAPKDADIPEAEAAMRDMGQRPLFMIRAGEDALDGLLAARGYELRDPVNLYAAPVAALTDLPIPRVTAFAIWEPLAIMVEIWRKGGLDDARFDVMARAGRKTAILSRWNEQPAGAAFAALSGDICMVHAVEVLAHQRRQGVAGWMMRRAAFWAQSHGATQVSVLCVADNGPANALYQAMGFGIVGGYHYRRAPE